MEHIKACPKPYVACGTRDSSTDPPSYPSLHASRGLYHRPSVFAHPHLRRCLDSNVASSLRASCLPIHRRGAFSGTRKLPWTNSATTPLTFVKEISDRTSRHDAVAKVLGKVLLKSPGVGVIYDVQHLFPRLDAEAADIIVHPRPSVLNPTSPLLVAYDFRLLAFSTMLPFKWRPERHVVAIAAEQRKMRIFATKVVAIPDPALAGQSELGWQFVPPAFDYLGTPFETTSQAVGKYATGIASQIRTFRARMTSQLDPHDPQLS